MEGKFTFEINDDEFKKSSWSDFPKKVCVLVGRTKNGVALRDSKDPDKNTLFFTHAEFDAFKKGVAGGEFDA